MFLFDWAFHLITAPYTIVVLSNYFVLPYEYILLYWATLLSLTVFSAYAVYYVFKPGRFKYSSFIAVMAVLGSLYTYFWLTPVWLDLNRLDFIIANWVIIALAWLSLITAGMILLYLITFITGYRKTIDGKMSA